MVGLACHEQIQVPGPEWEGQRSYVLAIFGADELVRLWAVDVDEGRPVAGPDLSLQGSNELITIHFSCPLTALGLPPGEVSLAATPAEQVPLPQALGLQSFRIEDDASETWTILDRLPTPVRDALRRLPVEPPSACEGRAPELDTTPVPGATGRGRATFALRLQSQRFLIGTATERYFLFDRTGASQSVDIPVEGPFVAGYEAPDETLWLLASDGRTASGRLGGEWTVETSSVPIVRTLVENNVVVGREVASGVLVGPSQAGAPFELYAATDDRTLARFDGTAWSDLSQGRREPSPLIDTQSPELVWLGPGRAVAGDVTDDRQALTWIEAGAIDRVERPLRGDDAPVFLNEPNGGPFESASLLMGTQLGRVYLYESQQWTQIGETGRFAAVPITSFQDDLLVGSFQGLSFRWYGLVDDEVCPLQPEILPFVFDAWRIAGDEWLLFTQSGFSDDSDFGTLRMRARPADGAACPGGTISL